MFLQFALENGDMINTIKIPYYGANGTEYVYYCPLAVSPNGRYIGYAVNPQYFPESKIPEDTKKAELLKFRIFEITKEKTGVFDLKLKKEIDKFNERTKMTNGMTDYLCDNGEYRKIFLTNEMNLYF